MGKLKKIIKNILPPFVYDLLRRVKNKPKKIVPVWNTFDYAPMKGVKMYFDPTGPWQRKLLENSYDSFLFDRIAALKPHGKVICDIGACVGFHTLYFARLTGPGGKVFAFEPNRKNVERISMVLPENPDIAPVISVSQLALSDREGVEKFNMNEDIESGRSSGGFIDSADTIWDKAVFKNRGFFEAEVRITTLDSAVHSILKGRKPDILKIDVEGAESLVLRGAEKTITQHRPAIFLEVHSMVNMLEVVTFLTAHRYSLEIINEEPDGRCFVEALPRS